MTIARHVIVTGTVQGVFFRAWTKQQAEALGVCGWVRNLPNGSVEALVEGEEAAVAELVERMRSGPSGAAVASLEVTEAVASGATRFEVRH
ncbi:acylphosphatase [Sphingomonas rhizophila]|uniref:Acylphosphatase n=1 Tax=Sphingomonas rhizophila TaxID=2071607 RepID=A0A7G9SBH7_9SPHN|nr:acylphosphatase [Sphingomonas rhizophila]QNN65202.1 acylphosphatase [Sphingomonas rhizophila]